MTGEVSGEEFNIVEVLLGMTLLGTEWVLWLLIILSVVSVAIIFERWAFLWRHRIDFAAFSSDLTKKLVDDDEEGLKKSVEGAEAIEKRIVTYGLERQKNGIKAMEETMTGFLLSEKQHFERGLVILGTLGNNAPFIGLFGTVLGIIQAFNDLAENPAGGASVVMAGISEALVATAVGLLVAIPAVIAFNGFQRSVKRHLNNAQAVMRMLLSHRSADHK